MLNGSSWPIWGTSPRQTAIGNTNKTCSKTYPSFQIARSQLVATEEPVQHHPRKDRRLVHGGHRRQEFALAWKVWERGAAWTFPRLTLMELEGRTHRVLVTACATCLC